MIKGCFVDGGLSSHVEGEEDTKSAGNVDDADRTRDQCQPGY